MERVSLLLVLVLFLTGCEQTAQEKMRAYSDDGVQLYRQGATTMPARISRLRWHCSQGMPRCSMMSASATTISGMLPGRNNIMGIV